MSLVGPRPFMVAESNKLLSNIEKYKLRYMDDLEAAAQLDAILNFNFHNIRIIKKGFIKTTAHILGKTKYDAELIPITSRASICSLTLILPILEVI